MNATTAPPGTTPGALETVLAVARMLRAAPDALLTERFGPATDRDTLGLPRRVDGTVTREDVI